MRTRGPRGSSHRLVTIGAHAHVARGVYGAAAQRAQGTARRAHRLSLIRQLLHLRAGSPKAQHCLVVVIVLPMMNRSPAGSWPRLRFPTSNSKEAGFDAAGLYSGLSA